eukprot:1790134-Pyramimonas_sp.AAC.1
MFAVSAMVAQKGDAMKSLLASFTQNEEKTDLVLKKVDEALNDPKALAMVNGMGHVGVQAALVRELDKKLDQVLQKTAKLDEPEVKMDQVLKKKKKKH